MSTIRFYHGSEVILCSVEEIKNGQYHIKLDLSTHSCLIPLIA